MKTSIRRGTKLFTKDGRKTGNAIVLGTHNNKIICESDFGNIFVISNLDNYWVDEYRPNNRSDLEWEHAIHCWYKDRFRAISQADTSVIHINQITCKHCGDTIQSRYCHDYVECKCGKVAVDGGTDYLRRMGTEKDYIEQSIIIKRYEGEFE